MAAFSGLWFRYMVHTRSLPPLAVMLVCWLAPAVVWANAASDQYAVAAAHYSQGRWSLAVDEFRTFVAAYPRHSQAELAQFYVGESLVQLRQYGEAARHFH